MNKLRWGIIGAGAIAHVFARAVSRSRQGVLTAVGSRTENKAREFAKLHQIPRGYGTYEELLSDPEVDAVYIATPHPHHREWAIRAARANKHILCEKPIGLHHDEAVEMLQAAWESNVFFMEAYMYRSHPQIARVLEILRDGTIGEVRAITASFGFRATYDPEGRLFNQRLGGGGILDVGGYCTSMVRLIAGAAEGKTAEPEQVVALGEIGKDSGVDEYATALLRFPRDIVARVSCGLRLQQENRVRVEGTDGVVIIPTPWVANVDGGETTFTVQKRGQAVETMTVVSAPLYAIEADLVAHHIAKGDREAVLPAMTWTDTLGNIRVQDEWRRALDIRPADRPSRTAVSFMNTTSPDWKQTFSDLFQAAVAKYQSGHTKASGLLAPDGAAFLATIGHTEQEFFDFVEDFAKGGEPTLATALDIASVRRDYFLREQNGSPSAHCISMDDLPSKDAEVDGIGWLPRLLAKAEAKLRGEMSADLMYGCGGDRKFFRTRGVDPAEFLRKVWAAKGNSGAVISWVKDSSSP